MLLSLFLCLIVCLLLCSAVAADIGVGITGKEGLQATRASDFSFTSFRYLNRLLLVHGRYSFNRTAFIAQYCFYKSLFICLVQLGFAFLSEFSGSSYFDSYSLVTYNLFYTSVPTMLYVLEQDLSPVMLQANPRLYAVSCQRGEGFTRQTMWQWMVRGVLQALVLLVAAVLTHHGEAGSLAFGPEGQVSNALVIYSACVLVHPITIALESTFITSLHWIILGGTLALFLCTNLALSVVKKTLDVYGIYPVLLTDGEYYLRIIVLTAVCILPVLACKYIKQKSVKQQQQADTQHSRKWDGKSGGGQAQWLTCAVARLSCFVLCFFCVVCSSYSPSFVQRAREADMTYRALHPTSSGPRRPKHVSGASYASVSSRDRSGSSSSRSGPPFGDRAN